MSRKKLVGTLFTSWPYGLKNRKTEKKNLLTYETNLSNAMAKKLCKIKTQIRIYLDWCKIQNMKHKIHCMQNLKH